MKHGRKFPEGHPYSEQEWGPIPTPKDDIIGTYDSPIEGVIAVRHIGAGPSGNPELEIEWEDGMSVTVLDEATAFLYVNRAHAVKRGRSR